MEDYAFGLMILCSTLLICLAGMANGIMDSIAWHDYYKKSGCKDKSYWLSSWKSIYDKKGVTTWWKSNIMILFWSKWHTFKMIMLFSFYLVICLNVFFSLQGVSFENTYHLLTFLLIYFVYLYILFYLSFNFFYR